MKIAKSPAATVWQQKTEELVAIVRRVGPVQVIVIELTRLESEALDLVAQVHCDGDRMAYVRESLLGPIAADLEVITADMKEGK